MDGYGSVWDLRMFLGMEKVFLGSRSSILGTELIQFGTGEDILGTELGFSLGWYWDSVWDWRSWDEGLRTQPVS